jgi:hypothetical protein
LNSLVMIPTPDIANRETIATCHEARYGSVGAIR